MNTASDTSSAPAPRRIVQWGTGNVGRHAIRAILQRDDLELVGIKVYSESKLGIDAGTVAGLPPVGVPVVMSTEEVIALRPDCVNHSAVGSSLPEGFETTIQELCTLLSAGINVTSSTLEHLVYPAIVPEALARLVAACQEGGTSFYDTGINPGFAMDLWPVTLSRMSRTIDQISVTEVVDMKTYDSLMVRAFMGFGLPPGDRPIDDMHRDSLRSPFYASLRQVADALHVTLDEVRYERETALAEADSVVASGPLERGTVAAMKMTFTGYVEGKPFLDNNWIWRVSDDVAPEWPTGDQWILAITGDPDIRSTLELATRFDAKRPVSLAVAMLNVNAIPTLCDAAPGVYTNLTLSNFAGGYRLADPG